MGFSIAFQFFLYCQVSLSWRGKLQDLQASSSVCLCKGPSFGLYRLLQRHWITVWDVALDCPPWQKGYGPCLTSYYCSLWICAKFAVGYVEMIMQALDIIECISFFVQPTLVMSYFLLFSDYFSGTAAIGLTPSNEPFEIVSVCFKPYSALCPELE